VGLRPVFGPFGGSLRVTIDRLRVICPGTLGLGKDLEGWSDWALPELNWKGEVWIEAVCSPVNPPGRAGGEPTFF